MKKMMFIILSLLVTSTVQSQTVVTGVVIDVLEGDIVKVLSQQGDTLSVKFKNIECPEIGQSYAEEAKAYTKKLALKKTVSVTYTETDRDLHALGTVLLSNGKDVGAHLLDQGLAWHYVKGLNAEPNTQLYLDLEQKAREKKKGLWKDQNPMAPWTFRNHQNKWEGKTSI